MNEWEKAKANGERITLAWPLEYAKTVANIIEVAGKEIAVHKRNFESVYKANERALQEIEQLKKDFERELETSCKAVAEIERLREVETKYQELLYQVESKFPNESRHETALRYIKQAETARWINSIASNRKENSD